MTSEPRLPMPDWARPGESWRVEAEAGWYPVRDGVCMARRCFRTAVAMRERNPYAICAVHMRQAMMWIEHGQIVSWVMRHD